MLIKVVIKNYIIIEHLEIDFSEGLNVLTGETGAGKSIILSAIRLSLGDRSTGNSVRQGADKAVVQTIFSVDKTSVLYGKYEDNTIIFTRELHASGRSILKVNGEVITLSHAKELADGLLSIHGQNDFQSVLEPRGQLLLVDAFLDDDGIALKQSVLTHANRLSEIDQERQQLAASPEQIHREIERVKFQMEDIDAANLNEDDEYIEVTYKKMTQAKSYIEVAERAVYTIDGDYNDAPTLNVLLNQLIADVTKLSAIDNGLNPITEQLNDMSFNLGDISQTLEHLVGSLMFEPHDLLRIENRLDTVNQLKKKYGNTLDIISDYRATLDDELNRLNKASTLKNDLDNAYLATLNCYNTAASSLTKHRKKAAKTLALHLTKALGDLKFDAAELDIAFTQNETPKPSGADKVTILISFNKGIALKPIKQAASGGEISRIMLAIKEIMADKDCVDVLIFDEIDAGISGETASVVADKLKWVSKYHQVILISHLAQVALPADKHFKIEKSLLDEHAISNVIALDDEARAHEIARIMGGLDTDDNLLQQARVLINKTKNR